MSHYPGLILTVGLTHEPIIYSLQKVCPQYIAFICTPDSERETINKVMSEIQLAPSLWRKYIVPDEPQHVGRLCIEFYNAYRWLTEECGLRRDKIATDPTAGRKWMSTGATMIGAFLGLTMHYVDVNFVAGKPDPSSMKLVGLGNAYDQTGFVEAEKGRIFFNRFEFASAAEVFDQIHPSLSLHADLYKGLSALAHALDCWDRFEHYEHSLEPDFETAFEHLRRHLNSLAEPNLQLAQFVTQTQALSDTIETLYTGLRPSSGFVMDVFENARRRIEQGRFDDACGRLYRTLESLSQFYLSINFGIDTAHPEYSRLSEEQRAVVTKLCGELPEKIDLSTGFCILRALDHCAGSLVIVERGGQFHNKFAGLLEKRNSSILAHGFKPIPREKVQEFLTKLEGLLQGTFGGEFKIWIDRLKVPKLPFLLS